MCSEPPEACEVQSCAHTKLPQICCACQRRVYNPRNHQSACPPPALPTVSDIHLHIRHRRAHTLARAAGLRHATILLQVLQTPINTPDETASQNPPQHHIQQSTERKKPQEETSSSSSTVHAESNSQQQPASARSDTPNYCCKKKSHTAYG
eukprot:3629779-Amphidinium_carterae.4